MKKLSALILLIFFLPSILAVSVEMKSEFSQGETLMAKVSGNFYQPVSKQKVIFYRDHVRVPMSPFVAKINNDFYIYAQSIGKEPANYSMVLEDARYYEMGKVVTSNIETNFSITNETADFYVKPGFTLTENNFSIELQNLQDSELEISIQSEIFPEQENSKISAGSSEKIKFNIHKLRENSFDLVKFSSAKTSYEVPVYVYGIYFPETSVASSPDEQISPENKSMEFSVDNLNFSTSTNSDKIIRLQLRNTGEETIEGITISPEGTFGDYVMISPEEISELEAGENIEIEILFNSDKEKKIKGLIKAKSSDLESELEVYVNFIDDFVPSSGDYEEDLIIVSNKCEEIGGTFCSSGEICDVDYVYADDGKCCVGTCEAQTSGSSGKIIGWIIVLAIAGFLIWFFKFKYKGAKGSTNILDKAKGKK